MLSHRHYELAIHILCKNIAHFGSQQGPVFVEKTAPVSPLFSPYICQRRMSSLITQHEKVGLTLNEHPDHLKVGMAGPTGIVEGCATAVIPHADGHTGFVQQEGNDRERPTSADNVNERLAETVAALEDLTSAP